MPVSPSETSCKKSILISGHSTSIALEGIFWEELAKEAEKTGQPLSALIAAIDAKRGTERSLASTLRVFVVKNLREKRP